MKILWQEGLFLWHAAAFSVDADHGMSLKVCWCLCRKTKQLHFGF